jgi:hypothetical protein
MGVDDLRNSRDNATSVYTEFTRLYKENELALYCFFEGKEDIKYYGIRIENFTELEYKYRSCGGKSEVLKLYKIISYNYCNARAAYFIDRDFDKSVYEDGMSAIYETPCHSLENFYTSVQCFSKIIRAEFNLTELEENFKICISLYTKLQKEFHDAVELLNVWIACHTEKGSKLNLSNHKLSDFIDVDLNQVRAKHTFNDLYHKFPDVPEIPQQEIDTKKSELLAKTWQKSFRGKFEIEFLYEILRKIIDEIRKENSSYFKDRVKVVMSLTLKTIISDLSQYADTPDCLRKYLTALRSRL